MGSVCGKHAKRSAKYEVAAAGACDAEVQAADQTTKEVKASDTQQTGHNSNMQQLTAANPAPAAKQKAKLDPKNFMFMNLNSETHIKLPGSVNCQQFIIDTCEGCDLYVMDACAMVTIDDCKDCRIFIGPTESSIFMRNCTNCKVACITRQLRTRDCHSCDILLMTRTRPIIESSANIGLGCYSTPYAGLAQQMTTAKLNPFHNFWSDVFDFTPAAAATAAGGQQQHNWQLMPAATDLEQLMGRVPDQVLMLLQQQHDASVSPVDNQWAAAAAAADAAVRDSPVAFSDFLRSTASTPETAATIPIAAAAAGAAGRSVVDLVAAEVAEPEAVLLEQSIQGSSHLVAAAAATAVTPAAAAAAAGMRIEPSEADVQSVIVTAGEFCDVQQIQNGCCMFVLFPPRCRKEALQWVVGQFPYRSASSSSGGRATLLRTNEAAVPAHLLKQMGTAAGWSKEQQKPLSAAAQQQEACVGLEVGCQSVEQQQQMVAEAEVIGGICCSSLQAAKLFRHLGTDG